MAERWAGPSQATIDEVEALDAEREAMWGRTHYPHAGADVCGLAYRPGEMSLPGMHYCRLDAGHDGLHSTRYHPNDPGGYEWRSRDA